MMGSREAYKPVRSSHQSPSPEQLYAALPPQAKRDLQEDEQAIRNGYREARRKSQIIQSLIEALPLPACGALALRILRPHRRHGHCRRPSPRMGLAPHPSNPFTRRPHRGYRLRGHPHSVRHGLPVPRHHRHVVHHLRVLRHLDHQGVGKHGGVSGKR